MSRLGYASMVDEVEAELGEHIVWTGRSESGRYHIDKHASTHGIDHRLLDDIKRELDAAGSLLAQPYHEVAADLRIRTSHELQALPENRLLAIWSRRRLADLEALARGLSAVRKEITAAQTELRGNDPQVRSLKEKADQLREEDVRLRASLSRVTRVWSQSRHLDEPSAMTLTPAMQRDARLRMLLTGLVSPPRERIAQMESVLSSRSILPPSEMFELWGAVRFVNILRALGWDAAAPEAEGPSVRGLGVGFLRCSWWLRRDHETIHFQLTPRPQLVDLATVPPPGQRPVGALEWAAIARLGNAGGLVCSKPATPDYALILTRGAGAALGIGDASLADPEFQDGSKVKAITSYRNDLAFKHAQTLVRCAPRGLFLILPGTLDRGWNALLNTANREDCHVLALSPGGPTEVSQVEPMLEHLRDVARLSEAIRSLTEV
jgi:hypothetical protein